jgi:hypothetical protein
VTDRAAAASRGGSPLESLPSRAAEYAPFAPLLGIVAYVVVLAVRVPSLVHDTATSDSDGPMVIAQSLPSARPGSSVVLGNAAHYTTLWFDEATRWLPAHRGIWQAMPYVLSLLGILLLAETVRRLAGPRAALVALGIGIATPPLLLLPMLAQAFHSTTVVNGIVLGSLLVWLARTPRITAPHVLVGVEVIAVVTGLDVASDPLLLVTGVAPFLAAAALLAWQRRDQRSRELLIAAGNVAVVCLVAAGITTLIMHDAGYTVVGVSKRPATLSRMHDNAVLLGQLVLDMFNGRFTLHDLGFLGPLRLLLGVAGICAALVPLWKLWRIAARRNDDRDASDSDDAPRLFLTFWGFTALFLAVAFIVTTAAADRGSMRYLVPGFMAVAATVPFLTLVRQRRVATAVALIVAVNGTLGALVLQRASQPDFFVLPQHPDQLIAALGARGLHHGYAGYWQANLLTWDSDGAVTVRAVQQTTACHADQPGWFCPYSIFTVSDWYTPQPGPSFLIREIGGAFVPALPPTSLRPTSVFNVDRFEIFVYDHDIGTDAASHTKGWPG